MEKIIGREAEFGKLTDYMESGKSEFIALIHLLQNYNIRLN